jgi:hypothetical protein
MRQAVLAAAGHMDDEDIRIGGGDEGEAKDAPKGGKAHG